MCYYFRNSNTLAAKVNRNLLFGTDLILFQKCVKKNDKSEHMEISLSKLEMKFL